ncbi:MAG TPA: 4Fe-4S binding protein [Chloroflexota bacterium]|nr:4Fe-4S binding protein [Chloroflexota bacterium]
MTASETGNALFIDYEFCTGCGACEMACRQEWDLRSDEWGIKVTTQFLNDGQSFNYVPIPTDLCNLCQPRLADGSLTEPSCVRHCLAKVMAFGSVEEMARKMIGKRRSVIWAPEPRPRRSPLAVGGHNAE